MTKSTKLSVTQKLINFITNNEHKREEAARAAREARAAEAEETAREEAKVAAAEAAAEAAAREAAAREAAKLAEEEAAREEAKLAEEEAAKIAEVEAKVEAKLAEEKLAESEKVEGSSPNEIVKNLIKQAAEEKAAAKEIVEARIEAAEKAVEARKAAARKLKVGLFFPALGRPETIRIQDLIYTSKEDLKSAEEALKYSSNAPKDKNLLPEIQIVKKHTEALRAKIDKYLDEITEIERPIAQSMIEKAGQAANFDPVQTYINVLEIKNLIDRQTWQTPETISIQKELMDERLELLLNSLKEEANNGNPDAMFLIGYHLNPLVTGLDRNSETEKSYQESLKWLSMGVKKGHLQSAIAIKNIFSNLEKEDLYDIVSYRRYKPITRDFLNENKSTFSKSKKVIEEFVAKKESEIRNLKCAVKQAANIDRDYEKMNSDLQALEDILKECDEALPWSQTNYGGDSRYEWWDLCKIKAFGRPDEIGDLKKELKKELNSVWRHMEHSAKQATGYPF